MESAQNEIRLSAVLTFSLMISVFAAICPYLPAAHLPQQKMIIEESRVSNEKIYINEYDIEISNFFSILFQLLSLFSFSVLVIDFITTNYFTELISVPEDEVD